MRPRFQAAQIARNGANAKTIIIALAFFRRREFEAMERQRRTRTETTTPAAAVKEKKTNIILVFCATICICIAADAVKIKKGRFLAFSATLPRLALFRPELANRKS